MINSNFFIKNKVDSNVESENGKSETITIMEQGYDRLDFKKRDMLKLCTYISFNEYNEPYFSCDNLCEKYKFFRIPFNSNEYKWIPESMLCRKCIIKFNKKYNIDLEQEIDYSFNGWNVNSSKNIEKTLLFNSINEKISFDPIKIIHPEFFWIFSYSHLLGLPRNWFDTLILHESMSKGSSNQGKFNGPDFIFNDIRNNKLIGLEIVSYGWSVIKGINNEKYMKEYARELFNNNNSFDKKYNELKKILDKKNSKKYLNCNELYLGIVIPNSFADYEYYILEILLNKYNQSKHTIFNKIYIL